MTDYMQKALELLGSGDGQLNIARTLEALDTANTRVDKADADSREWQDRHDYQQERAVKAEAQRDAAEKRERDLREVLKNVIGDARMGGLHRIEGADLDRARALLIQPEPDPLVEQINTLLMKDPAFNGRRVNYETIERIAAIVKGES